MYISQGTFFEKLYLYINIECGDERGVRKAPVQTLRLMMMTTMLPSWHALCSRFGNILKLGKRNQIPTTNSINSQHVTFPGRIF